MRDREQKANLSPRLEHMVEIYATSESLEGSCEGDAYHRVFARVRERQMGMDVGRGRGRRNAALVLVVLVAFVLIAAYSALSAETGGSSASTTTLETVASPG